MAGAASFHHRLAAPLAAMVLAAVVASPLVSVRASDQPPGSIRAGVIVPSVALQSQPDQSYALYLPSRYGTSRKWPVLFAFDPAARGERPLECFRAAAEQHGYVVVGSNVSRNGAFAASVQAGIALVRDVVQRFAVDERRLYATGFSGGARVASQVSLILNGLIPAVVLCGGGFPNGVPPGARTPFAVCGTTGDDDFNRVEVHQVVRAIAASGMGHRLVRHPGGHSWPPADAAMAVIEWLELEGMRAGTRPKDAALAGGWLQRDLDRIKAAESGGDLHEAWIGYSELSAAYRGVVDVQAFDARAATLQDQDAVKKEIKRARAAEEREFLQQGEIARAIEQVGGDSDQRLDVVRSLHAAARRLQREEREARTEAERHQARRLLEFASVNAFQTGEQLYQSSEFLPALACFELQALIHPESPQVRYRIALAQAGAGNRGKALEALKAAAERGFADAQRLEQERAFEAIRKIPEFQRVLDVIRANKGARTPGSAS